MWYTITTLLILNIVKEVAMKKFIASIFVLAISLFVFGCSSNSEKSRPPLPQKPITHIIIGLHSQEEFFEFIKNADSKNYKILDVFKNDFKKKFPPNHAMYGITFCNSQDFERYEKERIELEEQWKKEQFELKKEQLKQEPNKN